MFSKWHSNKVKPEPGKRIIVIEKNRQIYIYELILNKNKTLCLPDDYFNTPWSKNTKYVHKWAYVDELFKKELK